MAIKGFVRDQVLLPRLRQASVLVVYDPDRRYRDLCLELAASNRRVLDAGDELGSLLRQPGRIRGPRPAGDAPYPEHSDRRICERQRIWGDR